MESKTSPCVYSVCMRCVHVVNVCIVGLVLVNEWDFGGVVERGFAHRGVSLWTSSGKWCLWSWVRSGIIKRNWFRRIGFIFRCGNERCVFIDGLIEWEMFRIVRARVGAGSAGVRFGQCNAFGRGAVPVR